MTGFEQGVWRHLVDHHGADRTDFHLAPAPPRARSRRAVVAISAGLTVPVAGAIFGGLALTAAPPAYAFTVNNDGTVTVSLNDIATGIPALNQRLAEQGVRITAVPIEPGCTAALNGLVGPVATHLPMRQTVTVGNRWIPAGYHGFLAARQLSNGQVLLAMGTTAQPIPSCFPTTPTIISGTVSNSGPSGTSGTSGTGG